MHYPIKHLWHNMSWYFSSMSASNVITNRETVSSETYHIHFYFGRIMVYIWMISDNFVFFVIPVICPCVELAHIRVHGSVFAWQTQAFFVILWGKISSLRICYSVLPGMYIVHMHFFQLSSFVKSGFLPLLCGNISPTLIISRGYN